MKNKGLSKMAIYLSMVAVLLALLDSFDVSIWLSASSWLLVAGVLGIWAIYMDEAK